MIPQIKDNLVCKECRSPFIVNKKYCLCDECNFRRTHEGRSKREVYQERTLERQKNKVDKKPKRIKTISDKRNLVEKELISVYKKIDNNREKFCEGCGRGDRPLSHSHILSRKSRPDLICEEDNIQLHCFGSSDGCHEKWERGRPEEIKQMLDFRRNLDYIKMVDDVIFNKIVFKFEDNNLSL
jgi:hypothetical protein